MEGLPSLAEILAIALPAIVAITFHEAAHGFVAWRCGDPTAYEQGRVTFNPVRHIDLFGTIILPLLMFITAKVMFGWAKPVPIDPRRMRSPRRDMVLVAAAGPAINFALAFLSALALSLYGTDTNGRGADFVQRALVYSLWINVILAVFNLIPLPPLDGGRIAVGLLPGPLAFPLARLEPYGMWILIGVLFVLPMLTQQLGQEINPFRAVVVPIADGVMDFFLSLVRARTWSPAT
jgi:Zn-dependent protease